MASLVSPPLRRKKAPLQGVLDPLEALPEDLVVRILALLLREKWSAGIADFPLVSKRWNAVCKIPRLWEAVLLVCHGKDAAEPASEADWLFWLGQRIRAVKRLHIIFRRRGALCPQFCYLLMGSQLKVLIIDSQVEDSDEAIGSAALQPLARISSLQVLKLEWLEGSFTNLHELRRLSNLRELFVNLKGPSNQEVLPISLCSLSELRKLILSCGCGGVWSRDKLALPTEISNLSKLEELSLLNVKVINVPGQGSTLLPLLPALKKLALRFDMKDEISLVTFPQSLTSLSLAGGGFCESLAACTGLQQLALTEVILTSPAAQKVIELMARHLKHLRRLDLGEWFFVDESLFQLTTLRVLHADGDLRMKISDKQQAETLWAQLEVLQAKALEVPKVGVTTFDQAVCPYSLKKLDLSSLDQECLRSALENLETIFKLQNCKLQEVYLPYTTFQPDIVEKVLQLTNEYRKVAMHLGSPSRCGTKDPDLLPFEYDISPCYQV